MPCDVYKWATLLFVLFPSRHRDRQNTQCVYKYKKSSSALERLLLRFPACQLSFADAVLVIPSRFIWRDKRQSLCTYFQSGIKQLSHYNSLCCDHVSFILIVQFDVKYQSQSSHLQRWHWVCSWREQAIATPPPPIFSLHDWYICNLYCKKHDYKHWASMQFKYLMILQKSLFSLLALQGALTAITTIFTL